jgi:hypothetical protein
MNFDLDQSIGILSRTPSLIRGLLTDLPEEWLATREGPDTWSPRDVLGHLIHGEDTDWIPRARIILAHGEARAFEPFDRFAQFTRFSGVPVSDLLVQFEEKRHEGLSVLREWKLSERELERSGIHPELGRVTLRELLATWVTHDLGHIGQVVRVMAKRYTDDVGPWRAYIPVLSR